MSLIERRSMSSTAVRPAFGAQASLRGKAVAPEAAAPPDVARQGSEPLPSSREKHHADRQSRVQALGLTLRPIFAAQPPDRAWVVEFGCGHGHFLAAFAARHPNLPCLGVDFSRDRIRRAERKRQRSGLLNLHFVHAEAGEFLDAVPTHLRFSQIFVLFPDPWPKRRHRKNRLVSSEFLDRLAGLTSPGSQFYFRSDSADYVAEVADLVSLHGRWSLGKDELPFEAETVFQTKAKSYASVVAQRVG